MPQKLLAGFYKINIARLIYQDDIVVSIAEEAVFLLCFLHEKEKKHREYFNC